jgi:glycosyltransferase involved in cell wall biosynthesis
MIAEIDAELAAGTRTEPFTIGVPNLTTIPKHSGIGRVFWSLREEWENRVTLRDLSVSRVPLPVVRNLPHGVIPTPDTDLILLPQMTGAECLRQTQGCPSVVIVHDVGIVDNPEDTEALDRVTRWLITRSFHALSHATKIVTVSQFTRERLIHHLPEVTGRTVVIPNGVSDQYISQRQSRDMSIKRAGTFVQRWDTGPTLIYVGSEHPRKNVPRLLDALVQVKRRFPGARLLKIGKPGNSEWRQETLEHAARHALELGKDVVFIESVDDEDLASLYHAADMFVTASSYEGFCLPVLEAMAVGTPVVAAECSAIAELVGDAGKMTDPDGAALGTAVATMLADPDLDSIRHRSRNRATRFQWKSSANQYIALFEQVIAARTDLKDQRS